MGVLSTVEQDGTAVIPVRIQAPGVRPATRSSAASGLELHVREVHVSELHVREVRAGERPAGGTRARSVRGREVRSVTVRARAVGGADACGTAGPGMPGAGHAGQLRLTSRGRAVLAALAVVVAAAVATAVLGWLGAAGGAQAASHGAGAGAAHRGLSQLVVQPGQTLWSIARRAEPAADPRAVVQQIIEVNALGSATIQAGQLLWVPGG